MRAATLGRAVANLLGFQATWLACVGGAGHGHPIVGPFAAALWLAQLRTGDASIVDIGWASAPGRSVSPWWRR